MEDETEGFYRTLCSSETLRSGTKGFFRDFSESVINEAGDAWIAKIFGRLSNDVERVKVVLTDPRVKNTVSETLSRIKHLYRDKDASISRSKRLEGLEIATKGDHERALLLFSQAVLRAPATGNSPTVDQGFSLPLVLLARADTLMALGEYDYALQDLKLASEEDLPQTARAQLDGKINECVRLLNESNKSLIAFGPSSSAADQSKKQFKPRVPPSLANGPSSREELSGASKLVDIRETRSAGKHAIAASEIVPGDVLATESPFASCLLPEFYGTHCQHCLSRILLRSQDSSLQGDYIDFSKLTVEGLLVHHVGLFEDSHQPATSQQLRAPVGCPVCSSVAFCGRACRDQAIATYHKYECKVLALLVGSGMSVLSTLALRMVTQEGPEGCRRICEKLKKQKSHSSNKSSKVNESQESTGNTVEEVEKDEECNRSKSAKRRLRKKKLKENSLHRDAGEESTNRETNGRKVDTRAYDLVTLSEKRSAKDFLERTLMALFLLKGLQKVRFFNKSSKLDEPPTDEEIEIGALLLRNLQLLQFNAHEIYETRLAQNHRYRGNKTVYIGVAIYPSVARFNHDCYPAVTRYFAGRNIVIRALRPLKPGDVVAENYGPIFTKKSIKDRQRSLSGRYWFRCSCLACIEDWPSFDNLTNHSARLRCPTDGCKGLLAQPCKPGRSIKCSTCQKMKNLDESMRNLTECEIEYTRGLAYMEEENSQEAMRIFAKALEKFHRIAAPPHRETHLVEIAFAACMADSGNTWRPILQ